MRIRTSLMALAMAPSVLSLGACKVTVNDQQSEKTAGKAAASGAPAATPAPPDPLAARDPLPGISAPQPAVAARPTPSSGAQPLMQAQVVLDRFGFTPGIIDGKDGISTRNAVRGFQEAKGLPITGQLDNATKQALAPWSVIPATRQITVPGDFAAGPYAAIPKDAEAQAKLPCLCYASLDEKLAERFHTRIPTLIALNPDITTPKAAATPALAGSDPALPSLFHAGQTLIVPNIGGDALGASVNTDAAWRKTLAMLGVGSEQPAAARIVVSKGKGTLKAYDAGGKLIAVYTATMGSAHDPLPLGQWKILGIGHNPKFHYNPKLFWDANDAKPKAVLPAGPNNPVGVVWIDLNIPHYGIHGTPSPETIGRAESHGCVRLTNWDAARLAQMVSTRTEVLFEA